MAYVAHDAGLFQKEGPKVCRPVGVASPSAVLAGSADLTIGFLRAAVRRPHRLRYRRPFIDEVVR